MDLIILVFLCQKNRKLAITKGLSPGKWTWYTIAAWLSAEFVGLIIGIILFGSKQLEAFANKAPYEQSGLYGLMAIGLISAFGGYLIVRSKLEKMPDSYDEGINKINVSDLMPPPKN